MSTNKLIRKAFAAWLVVIDLTISSNACSPQTAGGVEIDFASTTLTSIESCDSNYNDPNNMGAYLFSQNEAGTSTHVSPNFKVKEFVSPDGDDYFRLSPYLVECLQAVRDDLGEPVYVEEAYRTNYYNNQIHGPSTTGHLSGTAAHIYAHNIDILDVSESIICNCLDIFRREDFEIELGLYENSIYVGMSYNYIYRVETGAQYSLSEWNSFITSTYSSCRNTVNIINPDGTVSFPNVDLTPITSTDPNYDDINDSGTSLFSAKDAGSGTYLSNHFQVSEFLSNDGSDGFRLAPELIECLQDVRDDTMVPISIKSGYRSVYWNNYVGGAKYSRHLSGTAVNAAARVISIYMFAESVICNCRRIFIQNGQEIGLGMGANYLHIDMRPYYSSWVYSDAHLSKGLWNAYVLNTYESC